MATINRQYGRRGATNTNNAKIVSSDSGVPLSPSSTGSTLAPPRRYVLDVPTSRARRTRHSSTNQVVDANNEIYAHRLGSDGTITNSNAITTDIYTNNGEQLPRSGSKEYYYRDGGIEYSTSTSNRYLEDSTIKQMIQSNPTYQITAAEDAEVQALTAKATPDVKNYPINVDPNPELVVRPNTQRLTYTQDIAVRYLKPNTPPPPGPIIIREIRAPAPPAAPPMVLRQRPPPPRTPSPIIIREKPPARPKSVPTTIIRKIIQPPPPPPRKLIIERLPNLPPKPRPVIIERWLPYHKQKRQVIHEKAKPLEPTARIKNTIIEWRTPEVEVVKHVKQLGITEADPQRYYTQHGDKLYATEFVQRKLTELGLQEELALMQEQQLSAAKEETAIEQADDYSVRQILNGYNQSSLSRQTYGGSTTARLVRSSSQSDIVNEYGDQQQVMYEYTPDSSGSVVYETNNYTTDGITSNAPVLTEEMLVRSHTNSGGKFPTHLLTKLGSQVYDMPSDQVELENDGRRITKMTTRTRYYTVTQGEGGYESTADETSEASPRYTEEKYVQIKASDLQDVLANYDVYSNQGAKLEGEQINY
ncbi:unnamed protein product [Rotaria magnacalcarata]|uniref:Uncharacterized protein n=4 Tax=Rotaria magnacalcarata TaxID=392030 RepID=A0A814TIB1_9BILA|nr:unnamed protein product [Rotaria magnacalcarata]CAF1584583.1 unnamed protein product [Rotaria magnacalcarata]CAF2036052.1 unnamed protein product [Rotaria magnacalcarata]CAF2040360.1 unnamed protein product [Rotaria magnacalcarata]CAF2165402.1 unnamed protein product [Rotaria magnacalcarata]